MQPDFRDTPTDLNSALAELHATRADFNASISGSKADRIRPARRYWAAVEVTLHSLVQSMISGQPIDLEALALIGTLKELAGYLAVGQVPASMLDVVQRGRASPGPTERKHIRAAVTYRHAVEGGLVADAAPTKTVCDEYGVDKRTATGWFREYPAFPARFDDTPATITSRMKEAGRYYREGGRSGKAINRRARSSGGGS